MTPKSLIENICTEFIERLIDENQILLSSTAIEDCSDNQFKILISAWSNANSSQKETLMEFYRLGAQNSIASILNLIDEELILKTPDGHSLEGDLLELFWVNQENKGYVNQTI